MNDKVISSFRGEYEFLSNMYHSPIIVNGLKLTCAEALFQMMKTKRPEERIHFINISGPDAKRLGRCVKLRPDWEEIKIDVMRWVIHQKFKEPTLRQKLLDTGDATLIEGNTWGDQFWGCYYGDGQNWLGKILMDERTKLKEEMTNG